MTGKANGSTSTTMVDCIHACGEQVSEHSETGECKNCRSGFRYWNKKTPTDRLKRRNKLDVLSSRLDTHFDTRGKQNKEALVQPKPEQTKTKVILTRERRK